jgi:group I intron endonuclease
LTKQLARGKSAIYKAFLKYDYSNFQVIILEYCEPSNLIKIEQKYIDLHKPEYNLLTLAGSRLGHKVSTESKALIRAAVLGRVLTKETRTRIGAGLGTPVVVMDLKLNNSTSYVSIAEAARSLNTYPKAI